jgi:hypothetical protein
MPLRQLKPLGDSKPLIDLSNYFHRGKPFKCERWIQTVTVAP